MSSEREQGYTDEVVASFDAAPARLREVVQSLVRHLHAFALEVRLTEEEWAAGIRFLTRAGHITDDVRQEFVLLSDVLGLSMLTVAINAGRSPEATESTVLGPFYVDNAPEVELGGDIARGAKGLPGWVSGRVTSTDGTPVPGARLDVWEADEDGRYDVQYPGGRLAGRGRLWADGEGGYRFWSVLPSPYPIAHDGPVGDLLAAASRSPMRPAHLHFRVRAPGHRTLVTHLFIAGDEHLDHDAVFGVRRSLIVDAVREGPGIAPDGSRRDAAWARIGFDIVLAPER